jgi:peptidoglycan/LPS O-acetylase OafA/YrhL
VAKPAVAWLAIGSLAYVVVAAKPSTPLWYMTVAMLSTLLILSLLGERPPAAPPVLERVLGSRPLAYTGKVSYGIYLFHVPIYYLVWAYAPNRSALLYLAVVGALSLACAAASWELVEKRIVRARSPSPTRRTAKPSYRSAHRAAAFVA